MAVTYSAATKTARMTAVLNQIDGAANAGTIRVRKTGGVTVAIFQPGSKPFGTVSGDILTISADPDLTDDALAAGTVTSAVITTSTGATVISGLTVGTVGTDIIIDNDTVTLGQTMTLTSGTITHA